MQNRSTIFSTFKSSKKSELYIKYDNILKDKCCDEVVITETFTSYATIYAVGHTKVRKQSIKNICKAFY